MPSARTRPRAEARMPRRVSSSSPTCSISSPTPRLISAVERLDEDANGFVLAVLVLPASRPALELDPAHAIGIAWEIAGKALAGRIKHKIVDIAPHPHALLHGGDQAIDAVATELLLEQRRLGFDAAGELLFKGGSCAPERSRAQEQHASPEYERVKRRETKARSPNDSRQGHEADILSRAQFPEARYRSPYRSWRAAG